mmetsp:Transcript_26239/g.54804  ORF Transcript_26239/g.54804 Transcript_26239/m.54804 type:complete len:83 (+) Transcript_26239:1899-2147(+)
MNHSTALEISKRKVDLMDCVEVLDIVLENGSKACEALVIVDVLHAGKSVDCSLHLIRRIDHVLHQYFTARLLFHPLQNQFVE